MRKAIASACRPMTKLWNSVSPGSRVLMYHRVTDLGQYDQLTVRPEVFEQQLRELKENHNVLTLSDSLQHNKSSVAITFDDGYLDNFQEAAPLLKKYELPALIYLTSDFVEQNLSHPRYKSAERMHMEK